MKDLATHFENIGADVAKYTIPSLAMRIQANYKSFAGSLLFLSLRYTATTLSNCLPSARGINVGQEKAKASQKAASRF